MSELEQLRDRVEQLEGVLGLNISLPDALGLTLTKAKMAGLLFRRDIVSREMFLDCLYGGRLNEPDPKTIEVHLSHLRRILSSYNIAVRNRFGIGWYISAPDKLKLKSLMETA